MAPLPSPLERWSAFTSNMAFLFLLFVCSLKKIKCFYAMPFQMSEFQVSTTHTVYGSDRGPYHNHHHHQVGINFINS